MYILYYIYIICVHIYLLICVISQKMVIDGIQRLYAFARSLLSPWHSGWIRVESSKLLAAVSAICGRSLSFGRLATPRM